MPSISPGLRVAWSLAAYEAGMAGQVRIGPGYLFIGLCKLEDISTQSRLRKLQIAESDMASAKAEVEALVQLFARFNLVPKTLRRAMRHLAGKGPIKNKEEMPTTMHRSQQSRAIFNRADSLARDRGVAATTGFHLLAALLEDPQDKTGVLLQEHHVDVAALREAALRYALPPEGDGPEAGEVSPPAANPVLSRYGRDLTREARAGKLHPAIGRKKEMLQVVRTLSRATKNNPLLLGEPGVGKTAVVEGLAWRIAAGNAPETVLGKRIIQIQMADLVAGTKYRGEFEARLQGLVSEVAATADVILFLDEIHTLVGAGNAEGALNAADILKPALAQGDLRCIGATTLAEYRKHIEKDPALERRFQPVMIDEPTAEATIEILRQGIQPRFEEKHQVTISEDALGAAAELSARYLPDRRLPDKAIDLLDEACARVQIAQMSLTPHGPTPEKAAGAKTGLVVSAETVAEVLAEWTGIPLAELTENERGRLLRMAEILKKRVIGQEEAVGAVAEVVQRARAGLKSASRPIGVLLFLGPTGVGKTELAKATAEFLFGSEKAMIRLDMSEFMEKHQAARLVGSPPGYVGSEEEGQLTGALRRKPFSVVLLDEIDKAHPDVLNLFLQVFDDGRLTDAKGRQADASNALFILTSNHGFSHQMGFRPHDTDADRQALMAEIRRALRPEFLNRLDRAVIFPPLKPEHMARIARVMLAKLAGRLEDQDIKLHVTDEALALLARLGYDEAYGARPLRHLIQQQIENPLGGMVLRGEAHEGQQVVVEAQGDEITLEVTGI